MSGPAADFYAMLSTGKWPVLTSDIDGATCHTHALVLLPKAVHTKEYLDTACHETLHASRPDLSEAAVTTMAGDIATVLWHLGYRLPVDKAKKRRRNDVS